MLMAYLLGAVASIVDDFSRNWYQFMFGIIALGSGMSPFITLTFVLLNEISGAKFSSISSLFFQLSWGVG